MMSNELDSMFKRIVLVTGFGPFAGHDVNASWEAVKLLRRDELEQRHDIELVTLELPVTYENVDEFVPALWDTHEPKLVVHVGVSSVAEHLTIETTAHRKGYVRQDYLGKCPGDRTCPQDGGVRLRTRLNVDKICEGVNGEEGKTAALTSCDAGRYLCEYIYYTSLSVDPQRTLFVHVPVEAVTPIEATARRLERVISLCLEQIDQFEAGSMGATGPNDVPLLEAHD